MTFQAEDFLPSGSVKRSAGIIDASPGGDGAALRSFDHRTPARIRWCGRKIVEVSVAPGTASKAVGYRGENREKLKKDFGIKSLKIVEKNGPMLYNILLRVYE